MKLSSILPLAVLPAALVNGQRERPSRKAVVIPNRFIVELKEPEGLARRDTDPTADVAQLYKDIANLDINVTTTVNFTSSVFVGTSVSLTGKGDIEKLRKLPAVKKIWPVHQLTVEPLNGKASFVPPEKYNIHVQTGVQKLHDQGNYGQGVIIAIVDTGVDYNHPDLGGGFGPGYKIESGWDFRGDSFDGVHLPDNDPFEACDGHGTHVTGIIAGNGTKFIGVAPQARIRVYKTINCFNPGLTSDVLIASHIKAYEDGADIISTSIGDESGWPNNPWTVTSDRIAKNGVFVISSAGNSAIDGPFLSSAEAAGAEVISVAASNAEQLPAIEAFVKDAAGVETSIAYLSYNGIPFTEPAPGWGSPYVKTGMKLWTPGSAENTDPLNKDGCNEESAGEEGSFELQDRVVLVRLTDNCTILQLSRAAAVREGRYLLFINDKTAPFIPPFDGSGPMVVQGMVSLETGLELERRLLNNETLLIRFPDETPLLGIENLPVAGTIADYSSWGLASDLSIKPDIAAPGSQIFSTFPTEIIPEGYFIADGTSMATPYVAGIVALYLSAHKVGRSRDTGKRELRDIAQSIVNRGNPVSWVNFDQTVDRSASAPVAQQGGGLIDATKLLSSKTRFSPNKLALNHTGNFQGADAKIQLTNTGTSTVIYNVTHIPGISFYVYGDDHLSIETSFPGEDSIFKDKFATAKFSTSVIELKPGAKKSVNIAFGVPTGFIQRRVPIYGGHIAFRGNNGEDLFVPYSGMAIDGKTIYEPTSQDGLFWLGSSLEDITGPITIDLKQDGIAVDFDLHFPVREAILDLVLDSTYTSPSTFKLPRVSGQNGLVGQVAEGFGLGRTTAFKPPERLFPGATFLNGTDIPAGTYRYALRVLKPFFEDRNALDSWSFSVSPPITVV